MASLYELSVPVLAKLLYTAKSLLEKGDSHFKSAKKPANYITALRLCPDMSPLGDQVALLLYMTRQAVIRLLLSASNPDPKLFGLSLADEPEYKSQRSLSEVYDLIDEGLALLKKVKRDEVNKKDLTVKTPRRKLPGTSTVELTDTQHLMGMLIPNSYFHTSMIYGILRANGVPLGKKDWLAEFTKY